MAYTEPPTISSATTATAADANIWSEDIRYLKGQTDAFAASAVKVNRTSAQSIPDDTWTEVSFNNQITDIGGYWSSGTDIIVPSDYPAGITAYFYLVPIVAVFATNGTGARGLRTLVNGSVEEQYSFDAEITGATTCAVPTSIAAAEEADVITLEVYQNSGGALNLSGVVLTAIRLLPSA